MKKTLFCLLILAGSILTSCQMTPDGPVLDFSVFNGVDWSKVSAKESEIAEEGYPQEYRTNEAALPPNHGVGTACGLPE